MCIWSGAKQNHASENFAWGWARQLILLCRCSTKELISGTKLIPELKIAVFWLRKGPKAEGKMSPKILLEKNKERENKRSEEEEKKSNGCTPSFYVDFFGGFWNKKTVCGERSILAVKNPALIFFFIPCGQQKSDKKGYILLKLMIK